MKDRTGIVDLPAGLFIGGEWHDSASGGEAAHIDPSTGKPQATYLLAGSSEVDAAVAAARAAQRPWAALPVTERRRILFGLGEAIRANREELSLINALENGTPLPLTRARLANDGYFEYYAGWLEKMGGQAHVAADGSQNLTYLEPVGVVALVLTWNSPMGGILMSASAALAAGCTVVLKPAEQTPFAAVRFARMCEEVGVPPGVVNVVTGGREAGEALVSHPGVDKISFTGGPETARKIQASAAAALTPLVLELGGKSASVVFEDAALPAVYDFSTIITKLSGQGCSLPSRLLVQSSIYDDVVAAMVERFSTITVGDPLDEGSQMGPVIDEASCTRIADMVDRAVADGASCLHGGERLGGDLADGAFYPPTLLTDVDPDSEMGQAEVFGPVLSVFRFDSEQEAIELANGTEHGLAAYVHTSNLGRALRMAKSLDAGSVAINGATAPAGHMSPFGGVGLSGYGRQGGREGLDEFLRTKNVLVPAGEAS